MIGETVGHYQIEEKLGAGGMGVVYRARDLRLDRDVALKLIRPESTNAMLQAAFLREARLASSLHHQGIVTIYDILRHGECDCIVMEFVAGESLARAIPPGGMTVERALVLAIQIGEAIAAAHFAGVMHRDLKPANILLCGAQGSRSEYIKILDFGLAKSLGPDTRDQAVTANQASVFGEAMVGTLGYMAPEHARGEAVDHRADLFAFGAILYQMCTGELPFAGRNPAAWMYAIQTQTPPPLRQLRPAIPEALEAVTARALDKDPARRPASAAEMVAELQAAVAGVAPRHAPPPAAPPAVGSEKTSIAVLAFRSLSSDPEDVYLAAGLSAEIINALTGVPGLRIAPQLAAFRLQDNDPLQAAASLNSRYVVSGTLRRAGERVRVGAELVDAEARQVAWTQNYNRRMTDIFELQEEISRSIVNALGGELIRATSAFAFRSPAQNLDAWGLVRKANHLWNYEFSLEGVRQALDLLRRAIALDPGYAGARAYLGFYLITTVINRISSNLDADTAEATAATELACQFAPEDPEVLRVSALVWQHTSQYEKAVHCLKRAVRLAPFDLVAWGFLAFAHACAGGAADVAEARTILVRLIEEAPQHPSLAYWHQFANIAGLRQATPESWTFAAERGRQAVEMQPGFVFNQVFCAEALCRLGRMDEARAVLAKIAPYNPHFTLAVFEDVAMNTCRSAATVEQLCGKIRSLGLFA